MWLSINVKLLRYSSFSLYFTVNFYPLSSVGKMRIDSAQLDNSNGVFVEVYGENSRLFRMQSNFAEHYLFSAWNACLICFKNVKHRHIKFLSGTIVYWFYIYRYIFVDWLHLSVNMSSMIANRKFVVAEFAITCVHRSNTAIKL